RVAGHAVPEKWRALMALDGDIGRRSRIEHRLAPRRTTDGGPIPPRIGGVETIHVPFPLRSGIAVLEPKVDQRPRARFLRDGSREDGTFAVVHRVAATQIWSLCRPLPTQHTVGV